MDNLSKERRSEEGLLHSCHAVKGSGRNQLCPRGIGIGIGIALNGIYYPWPNCPGWEREEAGIWDVLNHKKQEE